MKNCIRRNWKAIAASCVLLIGIAGVHRGAIAQGIPVYDASNMAQNLLTATRSLEQINNQLKMIEGLGYDASGDIFQVLNQTTTALNQIEGLAYNVGQVSEQFADTYPEDMNGTSYEDLISMKNRILQQTRAAQQHAMQLQATVGQSIPQTQSTVNDIVSRSNAAPGPTSATQANTQMLATLSSQISQMQVLLMAQTRALNTYIQEQNTRTEISRETRTKIIESSGGAVETSANADKLMSFENQ